MRREQLGSEKAVLEKPMLMRRVALPLPLFAIVLFAIVWLAVQGLLMARDRATRLQPAEIVARVEVRCEEPDRVEATPVPRSDRRGALLVQRTCPDPVRLALLQELPERELLRWLEPEASRSSLVLPLEGLGGGIYRIVTAPVGAGPAPREMDAPAESWPLRARFVLLDPGS